MSRAVQLLCFAHAGASAMSFMRWRRKLPAFIEVLPIELPGRGVRRAEPLVNEREAAIDAVERVVLRDPELPFALFGHSLGAAMAYAYAQRLSARGLRAPLILFASGSHAPGAREQDERAHWDDDALRTELSRLAGTPSDVLNSAELMELALPVLRADFQLASSLRAHAPGPALEAPIHVLAGTLDDVSPAALGDWRARTHGSFALSYFKGGHFFLHEREDELLALITNELTHALSAQSTHARVDARTALRGGTYGQIAKG